MYSMHMLQINTIEFSQKKRAIWIADGYYFR